MEKSDCVHTTPATTPTITTIFKKYIPQYIEKFQDQIPIEHQKAIYQICHCRTEALGGHIDYCDYCGNLSFFYHSCYHRSCPQCQGIHSKKWLQKQTNSLLPVPYFHIVFTVPHEVGELIRQDPLILLNTLFDSVNVSLKKVIKNSKYAGGLPAALCVLHTWNRQLGYHPHIHCLVPAVLIYKNPSGDWRFQFTKKKFFASVRALSTIFRAVFVRMARDRIPLLTFPQSIFQKNWVVYSKPTFKKTLKILQYLSLYIYRTAISNSRIISLLHSKITFSYKDSKLHQLHYISLDPMEFLRRFLQHVLPSKFHKIRSYGFLSPSFKYIYLSLRFQLLQMNLYHPSHSTSDSQKFISDYPRICPHCNIGILTTIVHFFWKKNPHFIYRPPPNDTFIC
jgi:hypothetical protein